MAQEFRTFTQRVTEEQSLLDRWFDRGGTKIFNVRGKTLVDQFGNDIVDVKGNKIWFPATFDAAGAIAFGKSIAWLPKQVKDLLMFYNFRQGLLRQPRGCAMFVKFVRSVVVVLILGWSAILCKAAAQGNQATGATQDMYQHVFTINQMPLTEAQVQGVVAVAPSIYDITDNAPEDIDKLSPETVAKLDAVARKNGFASYDEYKAVTENIGLVSAGIDPATNRYVGREAFIRSQIARVRGDRKMPAADKAERLADLNDQLQFMLPPVKYKGNIDLVLKYSSALSEVIRGD